MAPQEPPGLCHVGLERTEVPVKSKPSPASRRRAGQPQPPVAADQDCDRLLRPSEDRWTRERPDPRLRDRLAAQAVQRLNAGHHRTGTGPGMTPGAGFGTRRKRLSSRSTLTGPCGARGTRRFASCLLGVLAPSRLGGSKRWLNQACRFGTIFSPHSGHTPLTFPVRLYPHFAQAG